MNDNQQPIPPMYYPPYYQPTFMQPYTHSYIYELKKSLDYLTNEFNKLKSMQELQQNNNSITNNFIDTTVHKLKTHDETLQTQNTINTDMLSQMKQVDARLNSAFRKIERLKRRHDSTPKVSQNKHVEEDPMHGVSLILMPEMNKKDKKPKSSVPPFFPFFNMMIDGGDESKKKETNELVDSEDEYDMNSDIYVHDINKLQELERKYKEEVIELKLEIKSIEDLINIGNKYKLEAIPPVNKEQDKQVNQEQDKQVNQEQDNENINLHELFTESSEKHSFETMVTFMFTDALKKEFEKSKQELNKQANQEHSKVNQEHSKVNQEQGPKYYEYNGKKYSIDIQKLVNLVEPLTKLKNTIGMTKIKENILEMILYYIQDFESSTSNMLHTSIEGPPGVGKTKLGRILAQIYHALGVIPSKRFKRVRRTDLIGKYLGHTAHKTQEVINEAEGGVLFIDEAYSLGSGHEDKDIYAKECIDTINMNLTEKKKNLIVIIAGYSDQLDKSFFAVNEGLKRRFPFRFTIDGYDEKEMKEIFYAQVKRMEWKLHEEVSSEFLENFFKTNKNDFKHFGGDIETILLNCKMTHARRVLGLPNIYHKILNIEDLTNAYENFKQNKKKEEDQSHINTMYN